MNNRNTLFTHGKATNNKRFTLALIIEHDNDKVITRTGLSICSLKDNFSKKIGRNIAKGRATTNYRNLRVAEYAKFDDETKTNIKNSFFDLKNEIEKNIEYYVNLL